ncbi:phosphoglycolate phosphatase [Tabrizicola sp.]|uniref:phosphoglycolate phosphatase n=1 Tax=Tabrizicola sp. TaxID=2005166 RepID=UPI002734D47B|nr:phosphoglycolate phosphatase [Tabrizicola sp.]MDP3195783.1 phosphoglycolate phosphatase [Tabrizicola sp.]
MADTVNLVFDLDGTLIDSAPQIHAAANIVFGSKGLPPFSQETVRGFIGNGVGVLVGRLIAHQGIEATAALEGELVESFINIYEQAFDLTSLYPDVYTTLSALVDAGHRMAICTNKPQGPTLAVLRHFDLGRFFPVVIGGDTLPQRKPDPAPLLAALTGLGPGKALFVGDSEVDAETAQRAGIPFGLFAGGYRKAPAESLGARLIFDDHAALPRLVAHVSARL